jgi:hypothetical protein
MGTNTTARGLTSDGRSAVIEIGVFEVLEERE